jgi:hypothetical protein
MLEEFFGLENGSPHDIARFVGKWGPLGIRRVRISAGQKQWVGDGTDYLSLGIRELANMAVPDWRLDEDGSTIYGTEPIHVWKYWSRRLSACYRVWDMLKSGAANPKSPAWRRSTQIFFDRDEDWDVYVGTKLAPITQRHLALSFSMELEEWMAIAGLRLRADCVPRNAFFFQTESPIQLNFGIRTNHVFGGLLFQLLAALSGVSGFALCSACRRIYAPTRRPGSRPRSYCPDCRGAAADAERARSYRQRQRDRKEDRAAAARKKMKQRGRKA